MEQELGEGVRGSKCEISVLGVTSQWQSIKNWHISKSQEENKNLFIKKYDLYWTFKKYNYFPEQATLSWDPKTQDNREKWRGEKI